MQKLKITILQFAILAACLTLPLAFIPIARIINPFNPMGTAFINYVDLKNRSNQVMYITAIGTWGEPKIDEKHKIILRQFSGAFPAFELSKRKNRPIQSGETLRVFYETDEYFLSEVAVSDGLGSIKQIKIDPSETNFFKVSSKPTTLDIDDISKLEELSGNVKELIQAPEHAASLILRIMEVVGWISIPLLAILLWLKRRWIPASKPSFQFNWQKMPNICKTCQRGYDESWKVCLNCNQPLTSGSHAN